MPSIDPAQQLNQLPSQPGVYKMLNQADEIIYVGKAKNLKKRVASYFRANLDSIKTRSLVKHIQHVSYTVVSSEAEAFLLENNLIKAHKPRYNVLLRDDKSYPYLFLSGHKHPRLSMHRGSKKQQGEYFGPYPNAWAVRESLRTMQKLFPVRQCEDSYYKARTRPCLQYQLKRCAAPCVDGLVTDQDYQQQVQLARLFLKGKNQQVIDSLVNAMQQASNKLAFEKAARFRDQIHALGKVQQQQGVSGNQQEMDVFGLVYRNGLASIQGIFIRDGKVLGSKSFFPKVPADSSVEEVLQSFLLQFYLAANKPIPKQIVLPLTFNDAPAVAEVLSQQAGHKVQFFKGSRDEKKRYLQLANNNAEAALQAKQNQQKSVFARVIALEEALELDTPLNRMECLDISHTSGQQTVASCVVFNREGPFKSDYRRYNIEGITPGDDYAAMQQAMQRRYLKMTDESKIPDIIFIDGGKGQLAQAEGVFEQWQLAKRPLLIGVAKGTSRKAGLETLIFAGSHATLPLAPDSPALHLIQHIRDEAHRFAITGHRQRRQKAKTRSKLEEIPGVGSKRRQQLLNYLGGLQGVLKASQAELAKVPGISDELAENIFEYLHA